MFEGNGPKTKDTGLEIKGKDFISKEKPTLMQIFNVLPDDQLVEICSYQNVTTKGKIKDIISMYNNLFSSSQSMLLLQRQKMEQYGEDIPEDDFPSILKKKVRHIVACLNKDSSASVGAIVEKYQIQLEEE